MRSSAAATALLAAGAVVAQDTPECVDGLYMIVARGTTELPGQGATAMLTKMIEEEIEDSKAVAVDYPATFNDPTYTVSESEGVEEMQKMVLAYHEACPDNKMALFGYSQGGQVVSDVVCGGGFSNNTAIDPDVIGDSVIAMIIFGDPSFQANETFSEGTSTNDGIFERPDVSACEGYKNLKSYCDTGDVYCDGGDDSNVHGEYLQRYGEDVLEFVVSRFEGTENGEDGDDADATPTPGESGTMTGTATETDTATMTATDSSGAPTSTGGSGDGDDSDGGDGGGDGDDGGSAAAGLFARQGLIAAAPAAVLAGLWML